MKYTKAQFIWGPTAADKITFKLNDISPSDSYVVKSISGLEPTEHVLSIGDRIFEGGYYQGRRPENRQIVMLLGYQPNYAIGEDVGVLRKKLYALLSPKRGANITFRLLNDAETEWVQIVGRIKRIEADIFSKDPQTQITMGCFSAYFDEPPITHPTPASLSATNPLTLTNVGDVPSGFELTQTLTAARSTYLLTNAAGEKISITNSAFLTGDQIIINTNPGFRSITRIRSAVAPLNMLPFMTADSTWLMMDPGVNTYVPNGTTYSVQSFVYTPNHWGF